MKKKMVLTIILVTALSIATITQLTSIQKTVADTATIVKVDPVENIFYTNTTNLGDTFQISIIAENIPEPGFFGWQVVLSWTPGLINCTKETLNLGIWTYYMGPWITDPIDNEAGIYQQSLTGKAPSEPKTGTWWLVNLTFQISKVPLEGRILQTNLTISPPRGSSYCIADKNAVEIPHDFIHGVYKFISSISLPQATLEVTPKNIVNPSLTPCSNFSVNITIHNALHLRGFLLKLGYNKTTIECSEVEEGDMLREFGATTMNYSIHNDDGYTFVSINLTDPGTMAYGNGTLARFTFHVKDIGDSVLHIYETEMYDAEGISLPHITFDGYFNNILMPKLFVDPPVLVDPSMVPGDEFELRVKVANISDLYDFEFKLVYDTNVLNGLGIIVIPFHNETSFELQFTLDDVKGEIWVRVQYYPPAEPLSSISSVTLVRLFFQVQSYGATWLHFNQSSLSNSLGMPITHITEDGYVSILRRDVAIISISLEFTEVFKGWKIGINVTAKNLGDIPETFNVTLLINNNKVETKRIENLDPNATTIVLFTFDTSQSWITPCHNYTIKAEAEELLYEIDVTNNLLEDGQIHIKMMGDINGDGTVNFSDAIIAGAAFGSKPGDPNWNLNADLNRDGCVNYLDLIILGNNFGAFCVP